MTNSLKSVSANPIEQTYKMSVSINPPGASLATGDWQFQGTSQPEEFSKWQPSSIKKHNLNGASVLPFFENLIVP